MRYAMQVASDPISQAAFTLFDINTETAFVELLEDELLVKEGRLFEAHFPLASLGRASLDAWQWYMGIGLHTDFQGTVGAIASMEKLVAIPLDVPQKLFLPLAGPLGMQVNCQRLLVSVAEPDAFLIAFNAIHAQSANADAGEWEDKAISED